MDAEEVLGIHGDDAQEEVGRSCQAVALEDLGDASDLVRDLGELLLLHVDRDEREEGVAQGRGVDPSVEREERVLLEAGEPRLNGIPRQAELLGEGDDGAAGVFREGPKDAGVGGIHGVHDAQISTEQECQIVQDAQFPGNWLYDLRDVSMVTISGAHRPPASEKDAYQVSTYQMTAGHGGSPIQLLSPDGARHPHERYDRFLADVDGRVDGVDGADLLASIYEDMVVARRIDAEGTALQRQGQLGLWPPFVGQEAAQIGSAHAIDRGDFIFPSYREIGVAYVRGAEPPDLIRQWRGNAHSGWDPFTLNMAPSQVVIGAQTLHAVGYAMGVLFDGAETAVITYFGDGATSQGDVNESMVFAASFQAPVVFFCQNNQWAISEPVGIQAHVPVARRAPGFGIPSVRIDGNDVLACLAATREALERARSGNGPSYIEAVTYRMGPHTTADDPTRYRDANELEDWKERDPIARFEAYLASIGVVDEALRTRTAAKADSVAAALREATINMPDPEPESLFEHVYAGPQPVLERQRDHFERYRAGIAAGIGASIGAGSVAGAEGGQ